MLRTQLSDVKENDSTFNLNQIGQTTTTNAATTTTPAIDFKLNVKIEINSGRCVLHANKLNNGGGSQSNGSGRGRSDQLQPQASPLNSTNYINYNEYNIRNGGGFGNFPHAMAVEQEMRNTNFIFPAIGVKAFYESTHKRLGNPNRLVKKVNNFNIYIYF